MSKAYLNALYEEGTRQEIFDWLCRIDKECDGLRIDNARLLAERTFNKDTSVRKIEASI